MKKWVMISCIMIGFVLIQTSIIFAGEPKIINIVCAEWEGYTNQDGSGVYWEIVKAVYEPVGIKVETEVLPWKRADVMTLNKKKDAIAGDYYYKDKVGKEFLYPSWHFSVEDDIVAIFKASAISDWDSNGIKSMADKTVGWIRGYGFDTSDWLAVKVNKYELNNLLQGIKMLQGGRIDVLIDYSSSLKIESKKAKIDLSNDFKSQTIKMGEKLFLKFANTEQSKKLIKIYDKRMTELAKSGEIEKIFKKWGHGADKFGKNRYGMK